MSLCMLLEMAAEAFPDRLAVRCGDVGLRFGELLAGARRAAQLIHDSGAQHLVMIDTNSPAVPLAIYAAAYAGVPYVPINYRLTVPEQQALLERVPKPYVVGHADYIGKLDVSAAVATLTREQFLAAAKSPGDSIEVAADTDVAVRLFTSGTTGKPKSAVLRHENLLAYILGTVEFGNAGDEDAALVAVPPYHIAGISAVLSSTYAARTVVQLEQFDADAWLAQCREANVTQCFLVPTMLARIVDRIEETGDLPKLPSLRAVAYGGGRMPLSVIERAVKLFPNVDFTNAYGLTETSSTICLLGPDDHRAALASEDPLIRRRLASVGKPHPAVELQVRGERGEVLGAEEVGLVYVRGAQVSGDYEGIGSTLDNEGWFSTKDRGFVDAEGYLFLDGRADDVIVRGGENISPGEIEDRLLAHPAVADAAVVAIPDEQWGEGVGACVVLKEGSKASVDELQDWVRAELRSTRVPQRIELRQALPYNETGKLLRRVLKQELQQSASAVAA